jgi:BirA family transcriptional regulator, biotin operon repressor / biotin---[acetyl-CoA-carboxylase] ligase
MTVGNSLKNSMRDAGEFDAPALQSRLTSSGIAWRVHCHPRVDSTNRLAMGLARQGAPEGTVVIADSQTAGRGRLKRVWQSPPGLNLYLSCLLRPPIAPADASQITLTAGVAVAEAVAQFCPGGVTLKWPNDIQIRGRKVCGILTEMRMGGDGVPVLVVGIGLNVNILGTDFDPAHRTTATSLREEAGRSLCREEVAFELCRRLEEWYRLFLAEGFEPVRRAWLARSEMTGRRVRIRFNQEEQEGLVAGIDGDGSLLLTDSSGVLQRITAGDATILK